MRYRTLLFTTPGLAMIMALAGCGTEQATDKPADQRTVSLQPTQADPSAPADRLTVAVKASAQAPAKTWTLTCDPAGGDHPRKDQACATLAQAQDPFKAPPEQQICTKIYGGPEIATVKGTWKGQPVDAKFTRTDGCELSRWTKLKPLFGDVPKVR
ncbi:SSI family serine proteinase inhibitor [Actinomadura hibisca]|uniref:SSI family serine proteinase inhibitor n=1 Tax=Actinomadura hibisca TaxID=68565 RepID=UPI000830CB85|nr:SSI family serine proteinase inhibitor [Actinomadura hibisca]